MWCVDIVEYERGWGSRIDETRKFNTLEQANQFVKEFNVVNDKETVPDWYMIADEPYRFEKQ